MLVHDNVSCESMWCIWKFPHKTLVKGKEGCHISSTTRIRYALRILHKQNSNNACWRRMANYNLFLFPLPAFCTLKRIVSRDNDTLHAEQSLCQTLGCNPGVRKDLWLEWKPRIHHLCENFRTRLRKNVVF